MNNFDKLKDETCRSYGGNNCVLHGCMFGCVLNQAKRKALQSENKTEAEIQQILSQTPKN